MPAGEFPKTVMLRQFTVGATDSLGHSTRDYNDVRKCAARIWERSAAQLDNPPAEFPKGSLRLLLRLPPSTIEIGWRLVYDFVTYQIVEGDWRDDEQNYLATLDKI